MCQDWDVLNLFFWEGNSRSGVLTDAFGNFSASEWIFGRGILGQYESFVERHTIEMGWAQEVFNWGVGYVCFLLVIMVYTCFGYFKGAAYRVDSSSFMFGGIIVTRMLDGFVFGIPVCSVYSLLMFACIFDPATRDKGRVAQLPTRTYVL